MTTAPPSDDTMLEIDVRKERGHTVVEVGGELDVFTSARLRTVLFDPVLCAGPRVVIDLGRVTFMSSAGIRALIAADQDAMAHGGRLVVDGARGVVLRCLEITGLLDHLQVSDPEAGSH